MSFITCTLSVVSVFDRLPHHMKNDRVTGNSGHNIRSVSNHKLVDTQLDLEFNFITAVFML